MSDLQPAIEDLGKPLVAPFPWFGGKRRVASEVWKRLGDVKNYVEPFFGSGAVLLARPHAPQIETINDVDHYLVNFWRAVQSAPEEVASYADWPVSEADLHSRHYWLVTEGRARIAPCDGDPEHYDVKTAGWWLWGACAWIGGGWCSGKGPWSWNGQQWLRDAGRGINRKIPHVGDAGRGINRTIPHVGDAGRGINRTIPHVGDAGRGKFILDWMQALRRRLRNVRVACGDWARVCTYAVTWRHGLTGVFLDPPYGVQDRSVVYNQDCLDVSRHARVWAIEAGRRSDMRIAFAGYDGEHEFPADWSVWRWKTHGGYGSQGSGDGRKNAARETVWFSPACVPCLNSPEALEAVHPSLSF